MTCWSPHLTCLPLLFATSCSWFGSQVACSATCIALQPAAETGPGWDDEAAHVARCELLDDGPCDDCQRQLGELFSREYSVVTDCYCIASAEERDPEIEAVFGENGCDSLIDESYRGDPALLEDSCTCE